MRLDPLSLILLFGAWPCIASTEVDVFEDNSPTESPAPSPSPSATPSYSPTITFPPSTSPSNSFRPSLRPSTSPSKLFSSSPTESPAPSPTPTNLPSEIPTQRPSASPSKTPTTSVRPSYAPSTTSQPSRSPSAFPTMFPTRFSVTMAAPLKITIKDMRRLQNRDIATFEAILLQFLKENYILTHSDMQVELLSATVQEQQKVQRGDISLQNVSGTNQAVPQPDLDITSVVSAEVYDPSQQIPEDFDYEELIESPFERNMTGFLLMLEQLRDDGSNSGEVLVSRESQDGKEWIGILIISIASAILILVLLGICIHSWRKRNVPFADFGKDVDTSESDDENQGKKKTKGQKGGPAESWESEDSADIKGPAAKTATVDVHKCNSATCDLCTKGRANAPLFVRLTPRSVRWASIWQMTSPFGQNQPRTQIISPRKSAMKSPLSRLGSKKVSFDA